MSKPELRLHSPEGIALGALLGNLAGGAVLLWLNYRALGNQRLANRVLAGGAVAYLAVVVAASVLPAGWPVTLGLIALQTGLAYGAARALQGEAVRWHLGHGGRVHALPWTSGIGFLSGLAAMGLLAAAASLPELASRSGFPRDG
jgi:hypothetical protein